jgi:hypothetical protein
MFLSCGLLFLNLLFILYFVMQVQIRVSRRSPFDIHMDIADASQSPTNGRGASSPRSTPQKPAPTYQEFHSSKRQERQIEPTVNQFRRQLKMVLLYSLYQEFQIICITF